MRGGSRFLRKRPTLLFILLTEIRASFTDPSTWTRKPDEFSRGLHKPHMKCGESTRNNVGFHGARSEPSKLQLEKTIRNVSRNIMIGESRMECKKTNWSFSLQTRSESMNRT